MLYDYPQPKKGIFMKNKIYGSLLMLASFALSSAALADDIYEKKEPVPFTFMQKIAPGKTVGDYPILTLGNQWSVLHAKARSNNLGGAMAYVSAMDVRDGKFFAMLDMTANLQEINSSDWTDEPCKATHFLHKNGEGFRNINCATVNYSTSYFVNPKGDFQTYLAKFREMNIEIPPTVIRIVFTRYSDRGRRLVYDIKLNPEAFGIARDPETVWGANSWNKAFIERDPKKVALVAGLSKWADAVRDKMDKAFEHKKDAFDSLPPFESFVKAPEAIASAQ